MINPHRLPVPLLLLLLAANFLVHPQTTLAAEPRVMLIRPEKLKAFTGKQPGLAPQARNPFNWERVQLTELKQRQPRDSRNSFAGLTLSGIIWDSNRPQAVINDQLVNPGQRINGAVIKQIQKDAVFFEQDGIVTTLWMEASPRPLPKKDKQTP